MSITHSSFDRLVSRLECAAEASPKLYNFRVFLIALVGYMFPVFLMFLASLPVTAIVTPFVILITGDSHLLLTFVGSLLVCMYPCARAFFFKMPLPTGYEIGPQQAAPLFRVINEIRQKVNGQAIHRVILNQEFNASV